MVSLATESEREIRTGSWIRQPLFPFTCVLLIASLREVRYATGVLNDVTSASSTVCPRPLLSVTKHAAIPFLGQA